ncbi:probable N-acetyltransferase camello [Pelobates cultripes]|uniref:Probable N-acetyltransferase camello n=1 Tax=Pelobates cultripes TaxID=61616 RepID=A0AAD1SD42_PELCU|nr:probable N-acetyltransferase camello [Pelobates cultripes]
MTDCRIRLYQESDYGMVREVYAQCVKDLTPDGFYQALRFSHIRLFMLAIFLLSLLTTGSFLVSVLGIILVMVVLWMCSREFFHSYVHVTFSNDMFDIGKYYLQREGYGFWVAECGGKVVGTVAAAPLTHVGGKKHVELRRMAVIKSHRGRGIAKALCKTIIDFARKKGFQAVILETSIAQVGGQRVYESMGFRITHIFDYPKMTAKVMGNKFLGYQYDILEAE